MRAMKRWAVAAVCVGALALNGLRAEEKKGEKLSADQIKALEEIVDKAMKGYNNADHKAFYADFAKHMAPATTEEIFKKTYVDLYMNKFCGKLVSKTRDEKDERVVLKGPHPVLIYKAEFEKKKDSKVVAAFAPEGDAYKLVQLTFD